MSYIHSGSVLFQKQRLLWAEHGAETAPKHAPWKAGFMIRPYYYEDNIEKVDFLVLQPGVGPLIMVA